MTPGTKAPDLSVSIGDLTLRNPVLLASGTCGYGPEVAEHVDLREIGGVVTKTITLKPRPGNPPPRLAETPSGLLNSIGLENMGVSGFLNDVVPRLAGLPTTVIVSVGGESVDQYCEVVRALAGVEGLSSIELNVSCPNVERGMQFGCDPQLAAEVVSACRQVWQRALIVKLTPNAGDMAAVAAACESAGADALTVGNTFVGMKVDVARRRPVLGRPCGGLSGPAIRPLAVARVWQVSQRVEIPVIGSGGITCAEDALEHMIAGASAVQVGTFTFVRPDTAQRVAKGIGRYCVENGFGSVREIVGSLSTGQG